MKSKWIVFDAVGTVIYPTPSVSMIYHSIGVQFGTRFSLDEVRIRFRDAFSNASQELAAGTNEAAEEAFWREIVRVVLPDVSDAEACFRELFDHFGKPSAWACFDDVSSTLATLKQRGFRLAIASNFDRRLHRLCDELGSDLPLRHFERRVISSEVGYRKPAAEFYEAVLNVTGAAREDVLMVGDDFTNDVQGARQAGLRAIHLRRDTTTPSQNIEAAPRDFIFSLHELLTNRVP